MLYHAPSVITLLLCAAEPDNPQDPRARLTQHYEALSGLHLEGTLGVVTSAAEPPDWMKKNYVGSKLEWSYDGQSFLELRCDPRGTELHRVYVKNGESIRWESETNHASRIRIIDWAADLSPSAYFLAIPPLPFDSFLKRAEEVELRPREASMGASTCLVVEHPLTPHNQQLRIALSIAPVRVLSVELSYSNQSGQRLILERYTFSDWGPFRDQMFPRRIHKRHFGNKDSVDSRFLDIHEVVDQPGMVCDITVPVGSTYYDPNLNGSILVGSPTTADLQELLKQAHAWSKAKADTAVFGLELSTAEIPMLRTPSENREFASLLSARASNRCGQHCLRVVMLQLGGRADPSAAAFSDLNHERGASMNDLATLASQFGYHSLAVRGSMKDLLAYEKPMVIPVKLDPRDREPSHFVSVVGRSGARPIVINPPDEPFVASLEWLEEHWEGDALVFANQSIQAPEPRSHIGRGWLVGLAAFLAALLVARKHRRAGAAT